MGFVEAIKTCFRKYATFSGRALRSEYWWFYLFTILISLPFEVLSTLGGSAGVVASLAVSLGLLVPTLAATSRRFHDVGKSAWYILLPVVGLIPLGIAMIAPESMRQILFIVGGLLFLGLILYQIYLLASRGDAGENRFGPPPGQDRVEQVFS